MMPNSEQLLALRDAALSITSSLSLPDTLRLVVAAAGRLAGARYAALGVPDASGELLAEFVTHGLSAEAEARIAHRPRGHGLLGLVLRGGETLRLRTIADHPHSSGFPAGHPAMTSFLGVPVRFQGRLLGDLYLCDKLNAGEFSADDQVLIELLAAHVAPAIAHAQAYASLEARHQELRALNAVITATSRSLNLAHVLEEALRQAMDIYAAQAADIYLLEPEGDHVVLALHRGPMPEPFLTALRTPLGQGVVGQVAETGKPLILRDLTSYPGFMRPAVIAAGFVSLACLPLSTKGTTVGALNLFASAIGHFDGFESGLLEAICSQIAVAVENARLHEQIATLAVARDRQRLGMDLHDGVIQTIYAAGLILEEARHKLAEQDVAGADADVGRSIDALKEVTYDLRAHLLGLRPRRFEGEDLTSALQRLLSDFRANTQMGADLTADPLAEAALSENARTGLFFIAQEAISNAAKHSRATSVRLRLAGDGDWIVFAVEDNGRGLPAAVEDGTGGYGLRNMRDRVRSLGGALELGAPPAGGTEVRVRLPRAPTVTRQLIG